MFGAGGGTASYKEIEEVDVVLLWGSNAREAHPIYFHHLMKGLKNGAKMFAVDPRRTSSSKFADAWLGLDVGTDIAMANGVVGENDGATSKISTCRLSKHSYEKKDFQNMVWFVLLF